MTISLDATYSLDRTPSGVALYSREILFGLARQHPEIKFQFCYRPHRFFDSFDAALPANARRGLLAEPWGPRRAGLFHGLNQRLPKIPLRLAVATFHDLFVLTGEYSTPEFRARFARQARDAAVRSDAIVAVSEFTRRQAISLLGVAADKVRVIHHGARPLEFPACPREKVILSVGALQTRKNILRLVEAFESVAADWRLVLSGSAGYGADRIFDRIRRSPARERIVLAGYTTPVELAAWYARASVFAFPSLDEGFGMPVLEAMAAGTPVLTSNRSALPEVAGDAALLVNPEDTDELARELAEITTNEDLRQDLARRGLERVKAFRWEAAVRRTWELYAELLGWPYPLEQCG
ncbi:MAG: glycosyltransferase family 1 protein [Bryobacteraceae bacterium]